VEGGDLSVIPWEVPPGGAVGDAAPNENNGHCVCLVGYDETELTSVTGGQTKTMSYDFYDAYVDEAFVILSEDLMGGSVTTRQGSDLQTLKDDLALAVG
jgi:hypothetical protein